MGSLVAGDFKFSKRNFKKFIPWVFKYFPRVNCDFVHMGSFWDEVGRKLYVVQANRDFSVAKFSPLFHIII